MVKSVRQAYGLDTRHVHIKRTYVCATVNPFQPRTTSRTLCFQKNQLTNTFTFFKMVTQSDQSEYLVFI